MMVSTSQIEVIRVGAWRSLVAYLNGVQRAGGSNPLAPTNKKIKTAKGRFFDIFSMFLREWRLTIALAMYNYALDSTMREWRNW